MSDSKDVLALAAQLGKFDEVIDSLPPIDKWRPELSGVMDMRIKKGGEWWHEGELIKRDKLTRLFSSILKKEEGEYFLVTPVEKWKISVEDVPFLAPLAQVSQREGLQVVTLMTNVGDSCELNESNRLIAEEGGLPLVDVRGGLLARLHRNVYYQLADLAIEDGNGQYVIESGGVTHILG
jgi:hypothetical protein